MSSLAVDETEEGSLVSTSDFKKSRKFSPVHEFCRAPTEEEKEQKADSKWMWCSLCSYSAVTTTNMRNHLKNKHNIDVAKTSSVGTTATESVDALFTRLLAHSDRESIDQGILRPRVSQTAVDSTLVNLVIVRRLPFDIVEWPELDCFVKALNPQAKLPTSHNSMKSLVNTWFIQAKDIVRKRLQSSQTSIHLAVDIWTSPSNDLLLAVCSSFTDVQGSFRNILIGLRIVQRPSGKDQWEALLPVLQEYGIVEKIGVLVGDDSGINDTLVRTIGDYMNSQKIQWTTTQNHARLWCMGHILNLIVQAFLFQNKEDEEEMELYDKEDIEGKEEEWERYTRERASKIRTKMGAMGKVHNLVVHIRASPQRTAEFKSIAGKTIPLDNRTRWNSWYRMIQTMLEEPVLNAVRNYAENQAAERTLDKRDDLTNNDVAHLRTIAGFLSVFDGACLFLQGEQSTIERVLETVDVIQEHLKASLKAAPAQQLRSRIESVQAKLDLYISKLNQTPYYAAAQTLNPEIRTTRLKEDLKLKVKAMWESYCQKYNKSVPYEPPSYQAQPQPVNVFEQIRQTMRFKHDRPQSQDEYEEYCNQPVTYKLKIAPITWWLQDIQRERWPQLSSWAIEILSIPSMSDKPERVFSGGRHMVSWDKTEMTAATLEQLECGQDWKRDDLLSDF